jgi:hypothetical protein
MGIQEWIKIGIDNNWCGEVSCYTHDGPDMIEEEAQKWDEGEDPCMFIMRIWE